MSATYECRYVVCGPAWMNCEVEVRGVVILSSGRCMLNKGMASVDNRWIVRVWRLLCALTDWAALCCTASATVVEDEIDADIGGSLPRACFAYIIYPF